MPIFIGVKHVIHILALLFTNLILAQNVPKVSEIYDFDIGDEFHYSSGGFDNHASGGGGSSSGRKVVQITNKWHSPNLDSVYYVRSVRYESSYRIGGNHFSGFGEYVDTISFSMNETLKNSVLCDIDSLYYPIPFDFDSNLNCIDTVYLDTSGWYNIYHYAAAEWYLEGTYSIFAVGLGEVINQEDYFYSLHHTYLEYYKKDTIQCGTPLLHVGIDEEASNDDILIYPNPVSDKLHLSGLNKSDDDVVLKIYNIQGVEERIMQSKYLNNIELDVSDLISGMYMIQLTKENSLLKSMKFIKK